MKILFITDEGFENGGVSTYLLALKKELEVKNHTIKILSSDIKNNSPLFSDYTYKGNSKKNSISWYINKLFNFKAYLKVKKILKEFNPDVIHLNYIDSQTSPLILFTLTNKKVFMTLHDYTLLFPPGKVYNSGTNIKEDMNITMKDYGSIFGYFYELIKKIIYSFGLKNIMLFITPSKIMGDYFKKNGFKNIITIPNGIKLKKRYSLPSNNKLLYVGRLSKEKGIEYLIRAINLLKEQYPNIILDIIGDGELRVDLIKLVRKFDIKKNINFHGQIPNNRVNKYYKESSIIVIPSICFESFCLVGIEAMSVGRPVIASDIGGIPEWLKNNYTGLLVKPSDYNDLAIKINILLKNKKLMNKMANNSVIDVAKYDIKRYANTIEKLYKSNNYQ